jgi:hypothetical protein
LDPDQEITAKQNILRWEAAVDMKTTHVVLDLAESLIRLVSLIETLSA